MKIATMTFLYGKDRLGRVLRNHLTSLREWQTITPDESWLVVEPEGPDDDTPEAARELCEPLGVKVIRVTPKEADPYWNKARGINHAIRASDPSVDILMQVDADMILHPQHIEKLILHFMLDGCTFYLVKNHSLVDPVEFTGEDPPSIYQELADKAVYVPLGCELDPPTTRNPFSPIGPPSKGVGGCQAAMRKWWFKAKGYDELFTGWTGHDSDLRRRATASGRKITWAPPGYEMLHQPHPRMCHQTPEEQVERQAHTDRLYMHSLRLAAKKRWKRNGKEWGGLPVED